MIYEYSLRSYLTSLLVTAPRPIGVAELMHYLQLVVDEVRDVLITQVQEMCTNLDGYRVEAQPVLYLLQYQAIIDCCCIELLIMYAHLREQP